LRASEDIRHLLAGLGYHRVCRWRMLWQRCPNAQGSGTYLRHRVRAGLWGHVSTASALPCCPLAKACRLSAGFALRSVFVQFAQKESIWRALQRPIALIALNKWLIRATWALLGSPALGANAPQRTILADSSPCETTTSLLSDSDMSLEPHLKCSCCTFRGRQRSIGTHFLW
jgi:hypothetical protein